MPNTAPSITVIYDKTTYAPGDRIIATVVIGDPDTRTVTETWAVKDSADNVTEVSVSKNVVDPLTVTPPTGFVKTSVGNGSPQTWQGTA